MEVNLLTMTLLIGIIIVCDRLGRLWPEGFQRGAGFEQRTRLQKNDPETVAAWRKLAS